MDTTAIDWTDPCAKISNHFSVKEALWLPSWGCMHNPSEAEKEEILRTAAKMDVVREFVGSPINVHCWIRPVLNNPASPYHGQDYNAHVGGAHNSAHKYGKAVDWDCGRDCDAVRADLEPKLEEWDLRMERMPGGNWVHLDTNLPNPNRYFNP
jgi:hypothetical protein